MKKLTASLLSALMFLTSCMNTAVPDESTSAVTTPQTSGSVTSYGFDLDNLNYNPQPGIIDSTLRIAGEISPFSKERQISAPKYCMDGQYTYMIRRCPREITTDAEYAEWRSTGELIREIEVYENLEYSAPVRIIPLTGLDDKDFAVWEISYNPDDDNFYLLLNVSDDGTADGKFGLVFYKFSSNGEYIDSRSVDPQSDEAFLINKGKLYSVKNGGWSGRSGKLVCEDPFAGTEEILHDSVMLISFSDYQLYYVKLWRKDSESFDAAMFTFDPETGEEIQLSRINPEAESVEGEFHVLGACWDDKNDVLYVSQGSELRAVKNGEAKTVITAYDTSILPMSITDGYLNVRDSSALRVIYHTEAEPESLVKTSVVLKICCSHGKGNNNDSENFLTLLRYALEAMNGTGISVELEVVYNANRTEYANTMAKKLLSGDDDYDLFFVSSEMSGLFDSRYYEDLYQYNVLRDRYDHMIPGLKELCSIDGKPVLIPFVNILTNTMTINNDLIGKDFTFTGDYNSFFEFHDMIAESIPENETYNTAKNEYRYFDYWFEEVYSNFMARTISDDTAQSDILRLFEDIKVRCGNTALSDITKKR